MRLRLSIAALFLLFTTSAFAFLLGGGALPTLNYPLSYYATFANGPPATGVYFPVLLWGEEPTQTTGVPVGKANVAEAAKAVGFNTFLGTALNNWPNGFGTDNGLMALVKAQGMYFIGGKQVDYTSGVTATSVPSILATVAAASAQANFIGYNIGDEPFCGSGTYDIGSIPTAVSAIQGYDSTRPTLFNQFGDIVWNSLVAFCQPSSTTALQALNINSFDMYPVTNPDIQWSHCVGSPFVQVSDSISVPNDCIWVNGMGVQVLRGLAPSRPVWNYVETGGDAGASGRVTYPLHVDVTNGSNVIVNRSLFYQQNVNSNSPVSAFTATWVGLTVSDSGCIPANTTIVSISDSTHAVMSNNAACGATLESVSITGGALFNGSSQDCVASVNLCVISGNRWQATPAEVAAEIFVTVLSGAYGIEEFCHDSSLSTYLTDGPTYCLGNPAGGATSAAIAANLTYLNGVLTTYAQPLNATLLGICSMQNSDAGRTTATSCTDGILTMATGTAAVPGLARVHSYGNAHYLFAMSDRCSAFGATMTFTLTGDAGKIATVVYDSNSEYLPAHDSTGATHTLNGSGQFSDGFGVNGASCAGTGGDYQVRIYSVQ